MKKEMRTFVRALGEDKICRMIGVKPKAIEQAIFRGSFPTGWYLGLKKLADIASIECPQKFFNFSLSKEASK